uniref:Uncharacterized protein n=1 Tax=Schistocephalus solidus TaxID=70667 RepID=A0A0V0J8B5_SCHSO
MDSPTFLPKTDSQPIQKRDMATLLNGTCGNMASESVDINDLILEYVKTSGIPRDLRSRVNFDSPKWGEIVDAKLRVHQKPAEHMATENKASVGRCKSSIIFSSVFTNNTSETQTNNMRSERRTTSMCRMLLTKCVTRGGSLNLQVGPPNTCIQANGGFSKQCSLTKEGEKTMEEELVWSIDSQIVVPPGYRTKADLVITEDEYDGHFRAETIFEGSICVLVKDKKDGSVLCPVVINDLTKVLTPQYGFMPVKDIRGAVSYVNEGRCFCSYGVGQRVDLTETKIAS